MNSFELAGLRFLAARWRDTAKQGSVGPKKLSAGRREMLILCADELSLELTFQEWASERGHVAGERKGTA